MILQSMKDEAGEFVNPVPFVLEPDDYEGMFDKDAREYARQYLDPYMGRPMKVIPAILSNFKTPEELPNLDKVNNFIRLLNGKAEDLRKKFFEWKGNYIGKGDTLLYSFRYKDYSVVPEGDIQAPPAPVEPEPRKEECKQEVTMKFPDTMEGVRHLVCPASPMGSRFSKYDFGKRSIKWCSGKYQPSLRAAIEAVKKYHLFAIARALILRSGGVNFDARTVLSDTLESIRGNSDMKRFRDVYLASSDTGEVKIANETIRGYYNTYLDGTVTRTSRKFADAFGKPWDMRHFLIELYDNVGIRPPKYGKR